MSNIKIQPWGAFHTFRGAVNRPWLIMSVEPKHHSHSPPPYSNAP
jgi:hypothetical protein